VSKAVHLVQSEKALPAPITAVVLTKNESSRLARALETLRFCARTVVLDSGSTDGTRAVAKACGAEFVEHVPEPPFRIAEQRNWALDHLAICTPWVFFLDADEEVPAALARTLRLLAAVEPPEHDAYELTPRYMYLGRWLKRTQGYPNWHPRLLRHGKARFAGGVWEHFAPGATIGRIREPYDHFANCKGLHDWLERHYRYASWDADRVIEALDTRDFSKLGTTRKMWLRTWAARFWPLRPLGRFAQMYFLRLGFLEGWRALHFCLLYAFYEFMTVTLIVERRRRRRGEDL
jgi:glycosyltransferase involved in cell wall biosynthesis